MPVMHLLLDKNGSNFLNKKTYLSQHIAVIFWVVEFSLAYRYPVDDATMTTEKGRTNLCLFLFNKGGELFLWSMLETMRDRGEDRSYLGGFVELV